MRSSSLSCRPIAIALLCLAEVPRSSVAGEQLPPFAGQVAEQVAKLESASAQTRAGAAEALGFLRAYEAEGALIARLDDPSMLVRRQAAMALAWCGGRESVPALLLALEDEDWVTRQSARVSLNNLTGMEFPVESPAAGERHQADVEAWRDWWAGVPADRPPADVLTLLGEPESLTSAWTFSEIEVNGKPNPRPGLDPTTAWRCERGMRALGALGGRGASEAIIEQLGAAPVADVRYRPRVRAGIRALGRLRDEIGFEYLIQLLDNTMWARLAADALGDFGDRRAVPALLAAYPRYAKNLGGDNPTQLPQDDRMGFPSEDRMLETPYSIAYALCRLPLDDPQDLEALRKIAPQVMANLPGDHDTFMLYEPEVGHLLTRYLMEKSGLRQAACEHAMQQLGQVRRVTTEVEDGQWPLFKAYRMSGWLPAVCTEKEDLPRLIALLQHEEGWVRINAAKTLAWIGDRRAIGPIAELLAAAKAEADFGFNAVFKNEEYDDPAPRWREGLIRALGLLGADDHTDLIIRILDDERSVLEIRHAAAEALGDLGNEAALAALGEAASHHNFHSVRHIARDALRSHGFELPPAEETRQQKPPPPRAAAPVAEAETSAFDEVVFIKGNNSIPNTIGTVEQADRWRQTYCVTDSGPVYRPGRNLYVLRPARPDGEVFPLTTFEGGYVGDLELSWDASHAIFTHRGEDDPWWHLYRINLDGTGLEQLTDGPYHDVGPVYLPDGRIVFATSRGGIRDEYHGYPCTALWVMDANGANRHPIATNIGRDNEPAVLLDGRIVFSRLEVFYSRNKTELTLHAVRPDGTKDVVLYGPERRTYWRELNHGPKTPADGQEAPLTHRVLRMTQAQPMPDAQHIITVTQGGLTLVGPERDSETIISPDNAARSYTTPFPLPDGRLLCASTLKTPDRKKIDLGLYLFEPSSDKLVPLYNDPATADFEARPVMPRSRPPVLLSSTRPRAYSGSLLCASAFTTREKGVAERGKLVRLIEGVPVVGRHSTQTNDGEVWQNHGGTKARVLGTAPLLPDGSFHIEAPADRLIHFQVLDSDRQVVGNQLTWIYTRPGEMKSCVGCHENPHTTPQASPPLAASYPPIEFLPRGDEFSYRAKAWFKGHLPAAIEERTRTVRAINLLGR